MMVLSQLQRSFNKSFAGRHRWKLFLSALVLYKRKQDQAAKRKRKKREAERIAKGLPKKPRDPRKNGIGDMWGYLLPSVPFAKGLDGAGSWEILSMLGLCLSRVAIMNTQSNLVGLLDSNMMTRDQTEFWRLFRQTAMLAGVSTVHRNTYKYTEERLSAVWKKKLTTIVHKKYFKDNNYYNVSQLAAVTGEFKDVDARISDDIKTVSSQMAHVLCEALYASTAGIFFAWKLGSLYGVRYAVAPYVYLWSTFAITQKLAPVKWGKVMGRIRSDFASYRDSLSRLMVHQEAIVAMKGNAVEEDKIQAGYRSLRGKIADYNLTSVWHGFVNQLGFTYWLRAFVGVYVIGPHVFYPSVTDLTTIENVAQLRGTIGHEFVLFIQSMIAAGVTAKMLKQLQQVAGSAGRVNEMVAKLDGLSQERRFSRHVAADDGSFIEFTDVEVKTPTDVVLVKSLNFKLGRGESLLLTGHNGAGKSSIFRCLGGLWPVLKGSIVKPGGSAAGLNKEVFFLPQKPYNVLGTLPEQLTYPATMKDGETIDRDEIKQILGQVDLEYLLERPNVLTTAVNWEDALSLGEKQRLAIARLIYHKPQYAILDECTSAVSGAMERMLYDICRSMNITYITISHRPVLKAYHQRILTIGVGEQGYTIEEIDHATLDASETNFSNAALKAKSLKQLETAKATPTPTMTKDTVASAMRLMKLSVRQSSVTKAAGIFLAIVAEAGLTVKTTVASSGMMSCVFKQDRKTFVSLTKTIFLYSGFAAVFQQAGLYLQKELELEVKTNLSKNLVTRLMADGNFYKLGQFDRAVTDAEQRIAEDVRDLSSTACQIFAEVIKPTLEMAAYAATLGSIVGAQGTLSMFAYFFCGAVIIRSSLPNFKRLVALEAKQEGVFKNAHMRVKTHSESIAFFGGEKRELEVVEEQFGKVYGIQMQRLQESWNFGLVNQALVREAPMLVQWLLRNSYGQSYGTDQEVADDAGVELNSNQLFIYESVIRSFESLAALLSFAEKFANLAGLIKRVAELDEALVRCETSTTDAGAISDSDSAIGFDGVDIVTPTGQELATGMSVQVPRGKSLMVTGPNAVGKTSLFRVLAGLWPIRSGQVSAPCGPDGRPETKQIFLVPQRMYMPRGSLSEQVTYPERPTRSDFSDAKVKELLDIVGVLYLTDRYELDRVMTWEDVLSLGEQQRIGMARLFYHAPQFGVLDECTSAISVDIERKLYQEAAAREITCITISQRLALNEFHDQELKLGAEHENGWKVEEIA
jgi:ABC-type uncharacterized transport system fused permease/ATPase subunit